MRTLAVIESFYYANICHATQSCT